MSLAVRLLPEPVRSLAFGSIGAAYAGIGTAITNPSRLMYLLNLTDIDLMISWDGIDDHLVLATRGYIILDVSSNQSFNQGLYVSTGQRIYAKQLGAAVASSGSVYLSVFYGSRG